VLLKDGYLTVQAGAGIVADSDPVSEFTETENKAGVMMKAADMAHSYR
jgi:anthranilate synthase component 1